MCTDTKSAKIHTDDLTVFLHLWNLCAQNLFINYFWNRPLGSISATFYKQFCCLRMFCIALWCQQFGFVFFLQKNIEAKIAHKKVLVKLTTGVDFVNILIAVFLYRSALHSFYVLTVCNLYFLAKGNSKKMPNFENRTIPKLAKKKSSENSV